MPIRGQRLADAGQGSVRQRMDDSGNDCFFERQGAVGALIFDDRVVDKVDSLEFTRVVGVSGNLTTGDRLTGISMQ